MNGGSLVDDKKMAELVEEANRRADVAAARENFEDTDARWYIVQIASRTEQTTGEHLKHFKYPFYYPITRILRKVPRKRLSAAQRACGSSILRPRDEALWKGYMFVRFNIKAGLWRDVFRMRGVRGMVYNNNAPAEVPEELIRRIRGLEVDGVVPGDTKIEDVLGFSVGDKVVVEDGPFIGFTGVVDRLPTGFTPGMTVEELDESQRCWILLSIFGRDTPVELATSQFSKL